MKIIKAIKTLRTLPVQAPGTSSEGFFQEQLMAFQAWLQFAEESTSDEVESLRPPEQLPVVFQVLLSQVHGGWREMPL